MKRESIVHSVEFTWIVAYCTFFMRVMVRSTLALDQPGRPGAKQGRHVHINTKSFPPYKYAQIFMTFHASMPRTFSINLQTK